MRKIALVLLCMLIPFFAKADNIPPGHWQCTAYDDTERGFVGIGLNMKLAMQAAQALCRKSAKHGRSCRVAQSFCEQGPISLQDDHCIVTDNLGHTWNAKAEDNQDACRIALDLCQQWQYLHGIQNQCSVKHG